MLYLAKKDRELIDVVENEGPPAAILDPIARKEAFARRARLAVRAAVTLQDRVALFRLLFAVAQANKSDRAVESLLIDNVDLAYMHGDPATIQRIYLNEKNNRISWFGATHMRCAGLCARNNATHNAALKHLDQAQGWLDEWMRLPDDKRKLERITPDELAYLAEAVLRLHGFDAAIQYLSRWRPAEFVLVAARKLAHNVASVDRQNAFALVRSTSQRHDVLLVMIEAAMDLGLKPPAEFLTALKPHLPLLRQLSPSQRRRVAELIIPTCEAAAQLGEPIEEWCALLTVYLPHPLRYLSSHPNEEELHSLDLFLRGHVLLAAIRGNDLKADDASLLPIELRPAMADSKTKRSKRKILSKSEVDESKRLDERRGQFFRRYAELIPAYAFRAQVLLNKLADSDIAQSITAVFNARSPGQHYYSESEGKRIRAEKAPILADGVMRHQGNVSQNIDLIRERIGKDGWWDVRLRLADRATARPDLNIIVLDLIDSVKRDVLDSQTSGQEKTSTLVRCCRIASAVDSAAGQHYFDLAVEAAAEIDEEAFGLLRLIASLASRARTDSPTFDFGQQALAYAQVVENCHWRLEGWDHFPWEECIGGLTNLSPGVAASCLSRWDQRGIRRLSESSIFWAKNAIETAGVQPAFVVAWNLLAYPGSDDAFEVSLSAATQLIDSRKRSRLKFDVVLEQLSDYATREAPFGSRYALARLLLAWAGANGYQSHPALASVTRLQKLNEQIHIERTYATPRHHHVSMPNEEPKEPEIEWDSLLRLDRFVNVGEITQFLIRLREQQGRGDEHWVPPQLLERGLEIIAIRLSAHEFCSHLEALMSVSSELLPSFVLQKVLASRWQHWKVHPKVRDWFDQLAKKLASERFDEFFWDDCFDSRWLCELRDHLEIPIESMLFSLTEALTERDHLRLISPAGLYDFTQSLIQILSGGEAAQILEAVLPNLAAPIREADLAVAGTDLSHIPLAGTELEAAILWFLFGHPDKRIRWLAVHAARRMIRLGHAELLQHLAAWLSNGRSHPFSIAKTTFYWLSARQHFFLLIDRLASEQPHTLKPIAEAIAEEVISPKEGHALVLQFAKRAAIKLVKYGSFLQDKTLRAQLAKAFKSPFPVRLARRRKPRRSRKYGVGRFDFESTDTIPYWFEPLARVFDVGTEEICQAVERFVCDEWHFFGRTWPLDKVREWHRNDREWTLFSHRHGEEPTIDCLDRYLEFHGMMCAAASLLAEKRTYRNEWGDYTWKAWIRGWELADKKEWVADRRQATPLEPAFHDESAIRWGTKLRHSDFDRIIGLVDSLHEGCLMLRGNWSRWHYEGYEDVTVQSALVSRESSLSLLEALHFSSDPFDCWLPDENTDSEISETIGGIKFTMKGWTVEKDRDSYGIETHDPLRFNFKRRSVEPGTAFQKWGNLKFDEANRTTFRDGSRTRVVTRLEEWNDFEPGVDQRRLRTEGVRFWVTVVELLAFLADSQQSLLVSCAVHGKVKQFGSADSEKDLGPQKKLYLCHSDGVIETIGRSHRIGKAAR